MTAFEIFTISNYFQLAGSIAMAICCLLYYDNRPHYIRGLGIYAFASVFFSLIQYLSIWFFSKAGLNPIANVFVLLEAWLFSLVFYYATKSSIFKKKVFVTATLYTIFYLITFLIFVEHSFSFIRFGRDFMVMFYTLAYFYYLIRKLPEENLLQSPMFWINSTLIFYFSGTLILSFMRDYIVNVLKDDLTGFWAFRNFFRFGFCLMLAYAGWMNWHVIKSGKKSV